MIGDKLLEDVADKTIATLRQAGFMGNNKMIYLASPYTDRSNTVMENRYRMVLEAASELTKAGLCIYSPIVHFHPMACIYDMPRDIEFWFDHSCNMIGRAVQVFVLKLDEWESSIGIMREVEFALDQGIPVVYLEWEDRSAWPK